MILSIIDGRNNGKDNVIQSNYTVFVYQCTIRNSELFVNHMHFNLDNIKIIVFSFNETLFTYNLKWNVDLLKNYSNENNMIEHFVDLYNYFHSNHPDISIYNNPKLWFPLGSKHMIFETLQTAQTNVFKNPKCIQVNNTTDLNNITFYPCILKYDYGSHTINDEICNNLNQLQQCYKKINDSKHSILAIEYKCSFQSQLQKHLCIRFMVVNDVIYDFYARASDDWNIHTNNQDSTVLANADKYFAEYYFKNKESINEYVSNVHKIIGNGFYSYDVVLFENTLYLCEIGLKFFDRAYALYCAKHNFSKPSCNIDYVRNVFKRLTNA